MGRGNGSRDRVVIVGGGMAGARLARALGEAADAAPAVTVLAEEPHPAYNRVLLAEVLAGRYPAEVIALPPAGAAVDWRAGARAVRLNRARRLVACADGQELRYDRLVLATGSNPVLPPLRGLRPPRGGELLAGVHPFRTLDDAHALAEAARPGVPAVVIGGGLLGVSAARALAARGARVLLAHQGQHLMERQLDASAAGLLRARLAADGVETHTECRVRALRGTGAGDARRVAAVELADGATLDAELVVLACGVRPRVGLAREAGLALGELGGIAVDDRLTTSDPAVHALGDCAEHGGLLYGLAGPAQDQADVLASVLTGGRDRYTGTRALTRLTLSAAPRPTGPASAAGTPPAETAAAGRPLDVAAFGAPVAEPGDDEVRLTDATRGAYRKLVVRGDRLRGGILVGDLDGVGALARAWSGDEPLPDTPLLHLLTHDGGL
ncbi:FAD-dependent oxidoreductase [Streptomyces sp. DSM 44915]|uniref:FAD-dependent oxidoreductase n=1 Tax=Streptomyces chisholmiae TaxID=3075540 RepID=A0ABU2JRN0_9ACTN|nr:FAD-dependent oxidoreductase [Streptomyces sp. DSM 44915]MDT0266888.1 FAD-dependent oxidoreductase [Streptomyces sp. DSM 44915]